MVVEVFLVALSASFDTYTRNVGTGRFSAHELEQRFDQIGRCRFLAAFQCLHHAFLERAHLTLQTKNQVILI